MAHYFTIATVDSVLGVLIMINWIIEILQTKLRHLGGIVFGNMPS